MGGNEALAFDMGYARWLDEYQRLINDLRSVVNSHVGDNELRILVDSNMATCNAWSYDEHLIRVVICCGLYRGIVQNGKSFSLKTMEDGQVLWHSNSVNARESKIPYPWLVFNEKIKTKPALPALGRLIHSNDEDVLTDACWALSYLSDGTNDKVQAVIEAGVYPRLVELLLYSSPSVLIPALRMVGNIVTGDDMQTQCIINHQALLCLLNPLTNNHNKSIKKEACWTISNITASNKEQIRAVIEANIIGPLCSFASKC
ncbi:hypothetical protein VitviT2T_026655 [Vitis vinifera]|uniref:DEAD-box helicase OB fold domain-containing protein n=1 Tax=Vitis vinifera TaxID=29760 RepID=A0ABY9DN34_VITVI|nr:hypothetical protein VitviT2T_026655 [Vitis vinifera]